MEEHLITYIDFLGTTAILKEWDDSSIRKWIQFLSQLETLSGNFDLDEVPTEQEGARAFNTKPTVTIFSDLIVLSFPTKQLGEILEKNTVEMGLLFVHQLVSRIAAAAMQFGVLIRGGATIGPLYHTEGVVFGNALVDAYNLESKVASYPRIVISRSLFSRVRQLGGFLLLEDQDGIRHLNYFREMLQMNGSPPTGDIPSWFEHIQDTIRTNTTNFESGEQWNQLAKWRWFEKRIAEARSQMPNELFVADRRSP